MRNFKHKKGIRSVNSFFAYIISVTISFCVATKNSYAVVDFSGKDISGYDFTSGEYAEFDLRSGLFNQLLGANETDFTSRDLTGASFKSEIIYGNANGAIFTGAKLYNADFTRTKLTGADFTGAFIGIDESAGTMGTSFFGMASVEGGFSAVQLYSTASWKANDLDGLRLGGNTISGWNFVAQSMKGSAFNSAVFACDESVATETNPTGATNFTNANLANSNFEFAVFSYDAVNKESSVIFDGADLSGVKFDNADLTGVDFSKTASINGITIDNATLRNADFSGLDLSGVVSLNVAATFEGSNFSNSNLSNRSLKNSNFTNANFSGANLAGAAMTSSTILNGAKFAHANLGGVDFSTVDTSRADFRNAYIDGYYKIDPSQNMILESDLKRTVLNSSFTKEVIFETASYKNGSLRLIDFSGCDISGWDLSNVDLSGVKFNNVKFFDATNLDGAIFGVWTSLWGCVAKGFTYEMLTKTKSWNNSLRGVRFGQNDIRGWDFTNQDLRDTDWAKAQVTGTNFSYADLRGVDSTRLPADISSAVFENTIYIDGTIKNYSMSDSTDVLVIRPHGALPVKIDSDASISGGATLKYIIATNGKNCLVEIADGKTFSVNDSTFELWLQEDVSFAEDTTINLMLSATDGIVYSGIQDVKVYNADGSLYDGLYSVEKSEDGLSVQFVVPEASLTGLIGGLAVLPLLFFRKKHKLI